MVKKRKEVLEQGLVSTEEADELTATLKYCDPGEWRYESDGKGKKRNLNIPQQYTKKFFGHLTEENGVSQPGLMVNGVHSKCPRIRSERFSLTYKKMPVDGYPEKRIVQIDVKLPLPKAGDSDLNWPHIHYGQKAENLEVYSNREIDIVATVRKFEETSNIRFEPSLTDDDDFELK